LTDPLILEFEGRRRCEVRVARGCVDALGALWRPQWRTAALVGDANVLGIHGERVRRLLEATAPRVVVCGFPPGEDHKTRETKATLEDRLMAEGLDRQSCVVALGGGISLDLAGFVAATFLRGVPYINVPTSLLAQVEAAVGGKVGVNTASGKNLVGAFHQPAAVLVDSDFLATLPAKQWPNGLAEMIKHSMIADAGLFAWMEQNTRALARPGEMDDHPLARCVEIKSAVVQQDEQERGQRSILNFGHTVGHALEAATAHHLAHGRAVALGMVLEGELACGVCGLPRPHQQRLIQLLASLGIDTRPPALPFTELVPFLEIDKKRQGGALRMALPLRIGEMAGGQQGYTVEVELERLRQVWEEAG